MTSPHSLRGEDSFICFIYSLLTDKEGFVHCQGANLFLFRAQNSPIENDSG